MPLEAISAILRTLRTARQLTVPESAARIGVHKSTVYAWEAAAKLPEPAQLRRAVVVYDADQTVRARLAWLRGYGVEPMEHAA